MGSNCQLIVSKMTYYVLSGTYDGGGTVLQPSSPML